MPRKKEVQKHGKHPHYYQGVTHDTFPAKGKEGSSLLPDWGHQPFHLPDHFSMHGTHHAQTRRRANDKGDRPPGYTAQRGPEVDQKEEGEKPPTQPSPAVRLSLFHVFPEFRDKRVFVGQDVTLPRSNPHIEVLSELVDGVVLV